MERFTAADGRRLAYRDTGGDGPVVLCLAGLTRNGRDFDHLAERYAARYRVIRLDSRGRGGSEHADDPVAEYTVPVETGDALALLGHLGISRSAIVGTSRGGILGMSIAAGCPGLVSALVLNDIGAYVDMRGLENIMERLGVTPAGESFEAVAEWTMARHCAAFPDVPLARWRTHVQALYEKDAAGRPQLAYDPRLREAAEAALDPDLERIDLSALFGAAAAEAPVLAIRGENSDILSAATLAEMAEIAPGVETLEVANRGHAPFLDEAVALAAMDAFLERHCR